MFLIVRLPIYLLFLFLLLEGLAAALDLSHLWHQLSLSGRLGECKTTPLTSIVCFAGLILLHLSDFSFLPKKAFTKNDGSALVVGHGPLILSVICVSSAGATLAGETGLVLSIDIADDEGYGMGWRPASHCVTPCMDGGLCDRTSDYCANYHAKECSATNIISAVRAIVVILGERGERGVCRRQE